MSEISEDDFSRSAGSSVKPKIGPGKCSRTPEHEQSGLDERCANQWQRLGDVVQRIVTKTSKASQAPIESISSGYKQLSPLSGVFARRHAGIPQGISAFPVEMSPQIDPLSIRSFTSPNNRSVSHGGGEVSVRPSACSSRCEPPPPALAYLAASDLSGGRSQEAMSDEHQRRQVLMKSYGDLRLLQTDNGDLEICQENPIGPGDEAVIVIAKEQLATLVAFIRQMQPEGSRS